MKEIVTEKKSFNAVIEGHFYEDTSSIFKSAYLEIPNDHYYLYAGEELYGLYGKTNKDFSRIIKHNKGNNINLEDIIKIPSLDKCSGRLLIDYAPEFPLDFPRAIFLLDQRVYVKTPTFNLGYFKELETEILPKVKKIFSSEEEKIKYQKFMYRQGYIQKRNNKYLSNII